MPPPKRRAERPPDLIATTPKEGTQVPVHVGLDPSRRRIAIQLGSELAYLTPQQVSILRQLLASRQSEALWRAEW
jgi:hypothetical protein